MYEKKIKLLDLTYLLYICMTRKQKDQITPHFVTLVTKIKKLK